MRFARDFGNVALESAPNPPVAPLRPRSKQKLGL
jgi:hypothetical protein